MMGILEWQVRQSRKFRESRDIVAIAAKAADDERAAHADKVATAFEKVFGFKPELGEPVHNTYWIQGFRFGMNDDETGWLVVYGNTGGRYAVTDPAKFHKVVQSGVVQKADYATE